MMKFSGCLSFALIHLALAAGPARAAAPHEHVTPAAPPPESADHAGHMPHMSGMPGMHGGDPVMARMMALDPNHMRMGSGTAWHPDSTPVAALTRQAGDWSLMAHGAAWLTYSHLESPRGGGDKVLSQNWLMLMGQRPLSGGALMLRSMFSLDPVTVGGAGYPILFQTGESWRGKPLLDAQHPHDFVMELAADYSRPLGRDPDGPRWNLYAAAVGEPALGPEAFMHRQSGFENPLAPISHHWQDATHITWGVLTLGLGGRQWKVEGSVFNGHEPDENRWSPDPISLNSASARLWYAPSPNWTAQVSTGRLDDPEALEPGDVTRHSASLQYNRPLKEGNLAAAFVWGQNREEHGVSDATLLEANWAFGGQNYLFARAEWVRKSGLFLDPDPRHHETYDIGAYTLGYARDLVTSRDFVTAVGVEGMVYSKPSELDEAYGRNPWAVYAFLRIRPRERPAMQHAMNGPMGGGMGGVHGEGRP